MYQKIYHLTGDENFVSISVAKPSFKITIGSPTPLQEEYQHFKTLQPSRFQNPAIKRLLKIHQKLDLKMQYLVQYTQQVQL